MYPKDIYQLLKSITDYLSDKMTNIRTRRAASTHLEPYAFQPFRFSEVTPDGRSAVPYPRSGHRIGANSSHFFSFGGYNPVQEDTTDEIADTLPLYRELWRFNFAKREWVRFKNISSLPMELASNALILHKNLLMVYGGTATPFGVRCSNRLYVCRINNDDNQLDEIETIGQKPVPAYGQAIVYYNDFLYTIGGTTGSYYSCDIHRLNLTTMTWEAIYVGRGMGDYEPHGRYRHEVAFDTEHIFVLGGGTAELAFDLATIPTFALAARTWERRRAHADRAHGFPGRRRCHGAGQIATERGLDVFIVGGYALDTHYNDLWRLHLGTLQWTCFDLCRLPHPTYFHAAAATPEGRLYIFGGIHIVDEDEEVARSNCIYSTWCCVPKLSEICWDAVLHYSPHLVEDGGKRLVDMGLPRHFVQRIENSC